MNAPAQPGLLSLQDPKLFREQCYLDGQWVSASKTLRVINPATGSALGTVPDLGAESVLFRAPYNVALNTMYDVSPDGQRFVIVQGRL